MVISLLLSSVVAAVAAFTADPPVVFTGAHLIPIAGPEIDNGRLVIQDGKIVAVGPAADVAVPAGAKVIDCAGKVIMPGIVDSHSHIGGIGGADGSASIQPDVRISDSLNVRDSGFRRAVAGGLTTLNIMPGSGHLLSGQTIYVKLRRMPGSGPEPAGPGPSDTIKTIEDIAYRFPDGSLMGGMKMANGTNSMRDPPFSGTRGKSAAMVRQRYIQAQEYQVKAAHAAAAPDKPAPDNKPDSPEGDKAFARDLGLEALGEVLSGKRIVQHHTHRADDIMTVLRLAEEFKYRVVLHHVSEAWKVAGEIADAQKRGITLGCSVILVDSPGGKLEASEMSYETGATLERAGVRVAFHTDDWITDSRLFVRMAALAVRAGMTRAGALRALTLSGAEMLDLQARVGSLEAGKDADLVIFTGDPLSVYSKVQQTWVEGRVVFDRDRERDRLYATGGYGAGHDQSPYLCCFGDATTGWAWRSLQSTGNDQ